MHLGHQKAYFTPPLTVTHHRSGSKCIAGYRLRESSCETNVWYSTCFTCSPKDNGSPFIPHVEVEYLLVLKVIIQLSIKRYRNTNARTEPNVVMLIVTHLIFGRIRRRQASETF